MRIKGYCMAKNSFVAELTLTNFAKCYTIRVLQRPKYISRDIFIVFCYGFCRVMLILKVCVTDTVNWFKMYLANHL